MVHNESYLIRTCSQSTYYNILQFCEISHNRQYVVCAHTFGIKVFSSATGALLWSVIKVSEVPPGCLFTKDDSRYTIIFACLPFSKLKLFFPRFLFCSIDNKLNSANVSDENDMRIEYQFMPFASQLHWSTDCNLVCASSTQLINS